LEGSLSEFVNKTRQDIINIISLVELELDFAEEGLEFVKKEEIKSMVEKLNIKLENIIASYITGKVIREGVNLVIAGKPNSGKSSLFNYLLKTNRSIVSEVAGTTRDYIEESLIINGILFNLIDTAGLRLSGDVIESEGITRSHNKISEADLVIYLIDSSQDEDYINEDINYFESNFDIKKSILVFSKIDIKSKGFNLKGLKVSLVEDKTIEDLKKQMTDKTLSDKIKISSNEIILTNLRHRICLENVVIALQEAVNTIEEGMSGEFISVDLRNAIGYLGEITGEVTNDTILENIFRNFCIGK
jgi:tRNA modification GTPase